MPSRRSVLRGIGGLAMAPLFFRSFAAEAAGAGTIVVAILLEGGNDGLNTVIPLGQYGAYNALRTPATPPDPSLALAYSEASLAATAFDPNPATPTGSATQFAFNPSMTAMRSLYATGKLAVIAGIGLPLAEIGSLNHGTAQQDWQTGRINLAEGAAPGWLGLTLDKVGAGSLGPAISLAGSSLLLTGAQSQALTVPAPLEGFVFNYGTTDDWNALVSATSQVMALPVKPAAAAYDRSVVLGAQSAIATVQAIATAEPVTDYPTVNNYLDSQLREIARLILGGAGARGYCAAYGSFDTHSTQQQTQPQLLSDVSNAMQNFYSYLEAYGASSNVVVMTMSDFGRRPGANLNFGTDHGAASVSFVLGDAVKGGVYGTYPDLTQLDVNGNLAVTVDFRNMLSDVIQSMGGNPTPILGETYPKLGFI
jgi:uncharacterized protein (DUF1501 family)